MEHNGTNLLYLFMCRCKSYTNLYTRLNV